MGVKDEEDLEAEDLEVHTKDLLKQNIPDDQKGKVVTVVPETGTGEVVDEETVILKHKEKSRVKTLRRLLRFQLWAAVKWTDNGITFHVIYCIIMLLQLAKVGLITHQMIVFGGERASFTEVISNGQLALRHLLLKDWSSENEVLDYPPAIGPYAVYSQQQLKEHIQFAVEGFYNRETDSLALFHQPKESQHMKICIKSVQFDPTMEKSILNITRRCFSTNGTKDTLDEYLKKNNIPEDILENFLEVEMTFALQSIRIDAESSLARCLITKGKLTFINNNLNGQARVSLKTRSTQLSCKNDLGLQLQDADISETVSKGIAIGIIVLSVLSGEASLCILIHGVICVVVMYSLEDERSVIPLLRVDRMHAVVSYRRERIKYMVKKRRLISQFTFMKQPKNTFLLIKESKFQKLFYLKIDKNKEYILSKSRTCTSRGSGSKSLTPSVDTKAKPASSTSEDIKLPSYIMRCIRPWDALVIIGDTLVVYGTVQVVFMAEIHRTIEHFDQYTVWLGIGCLIAWICVLQYFRFHRRFHLLFKTLYHAIWNVTAYLICVFVLFLAYLFCGYIVLGPYNVKFKTISSAATCLFSIVNGDEIYFTIAALDENKSGGAWIWWFSRFYICSYVAIFTIIVINLLIAIFMTVYEEIQSRRQAELEDRPLHTALKRFWKDTDKNSTGIARSLRTQLEEFLDEARGIETELKTTENELKTLLTNILKQEKPEGIDPIRAFIAEVGKPEDQRDSRKLYRYPIFGVYVSYFLPCKCDC